MSGDIKALEEKILNDYEFLNSIRNELAKTIIGQQYMVDRLLLALISQGHILLEGMPGLAKTLAIKSLAQVINAKFSRIQFTPDLLPADLVGTMIYNQAKNDFTVKKGPIFANFVLADEINRAPAKVQSALLEAMAEKQVSIGENTFKLEAPFLVLATQNPIEQEGTYPLPEAQVDRFMLKVKIDYPARNDEQQILKNYSGANSAEPKQVANIEQILNARKLSSQIYMDEKIEQYILDLVFATRFPENFKLARLKPWISFGASPRATINLAIAAKTFAFMKGRAYVIPEDVRALAPDILNHRIGISYEAEAENINSYDIVSELLKNIQVP